jgi:hypothetical protein
MQCLTSIRDRPFNLQDGGLWFFVSFRIFFSDNTRVRIFIFLSRKARNFFPQLSIRLYDKNSESDFFFHHQNQNIFFSNIGNQNIFLEKKHNPLGTFHLRGLALQLSGKNPSFGLQNTFHLRWFFYLRFTCYYPSIAQITCNFLIMIMVFLVIFIKYIL